MSTVTNRQVVLPASISDEAIITGRNVNATESYMCLAWLIQGCSVVDDTKSSVIAKTRGNTMEHS